VIGVFDGVAGYEGCGVPDGLDPDDIVLATHKRA